jgi:DNA-binding MarR family transcriptional regulator
LCFFFGVATLLLGGQPTMNTSISCEDINRQCCCFNMRKVTRAVTQYYDRFLEPAGIRATQFTLLAALFSTKGKTLTEIADSLVMDRTTLTRNLKPLEKMGLISIVQTLDKRSKAYILTPEGEQIVERCVPLWQHAQDSVVNGLTTETYHNLVNKLTSLLSITGNHKDRK